MSPLPPLIFEIMKIKNRESLADTGYSPEVCYDTAKLEYEYSINRRSKLDAKINVVIAAYAFMTPMLCGNVSTANIKQLVEFYPYWVIVLLAFIIRCICCLWKLFSIQELSHFDIGEIEDTHLYYRPSKVAARYIIISYRNITESNNEKMNKLYGVYDDLVKCTMIVVIIAVVLKCMIR